MDQNSLGTHTILDLYGCDQLLIDDTKYLEETMLEAARLAKATIIKSHFHKFAPQGVSGVVIIAESHFNIHTWPEYGYAAIDLFTCGSDLDYDAATNYLIEKLNVQQHKRSHISRGSNLKPID